MFRTCLKPCASWVVSLAKRSNESVKQGGVSMKSVHILTAFFLCFARLFQHRPSLRRLEYKSHPH